MVAKLFVYVALACMLVQLPGCKKEEDRNLLVSNSKITFGYEDTSKTITISDVGSSGFTWSVNTASDLLEFSKTNGTCSKNKPDAFDIILLREKVHKDSISATVTITASTGETTSISLLILGFPEKKIRYNEQILAAAYDQIHNRLVLLSSLNSSRILDLFDLGTEKFSHIPLAGTGDLLSVSPDGTYAVVSSDNDYRIIYVDLVQKTVINTYNSEQYTNGIIACQDKCCYYFPYYNNSYISKLNLSTGIYTSYNYSQYLDLSTAVLHPSGNYIYTAGYSMLTKFNITNPEPALIYANTTYNIDSKIWFSKDGTRLFTAGKKILTIDASLPQEDITSVADVNIGQNYIFYLDHNMIHNEYYIIPTNSSYGTDYQSNQLLVLNNDLSQVRTIPLEPFHILYLYPQQSYSTVDAIGQYVFSSSDGSKIIVVSKASDSYSNTWGIEIIDRVWK